VFSVGVVALLDVWGTLAEALIDDCLLIENSIWLALITFLIQCVLLI